jgi:GNAT superfamily N-acetyltransferase
MSGRLLALLEATWTPAECRDLGPWRLRRTPGGGNRVNAATAAGPGAAAAIPAAERAMREAGQAPLFQVREEETELDAALAARGYLLHAPSLLMTGAADAIAAFDPKGFAAIRCTAPLARMAEIWAEGGFGPARLAIMARSGEDRCRLLGRSADDRPAGVAFAAMAGGGAMLHALYVLPRARRRGVARALTGAAAAWALERGARDLALAVTEANAPARALYERMGMAVAGRYHYRALKE